MIARLFAVFLLATLPSVTIAQTSAAFAEAITEAEFELSVPNNARWRIFPDRFENLNDKGEVRGQLKAEMIEPGIIRGSYGSGLQAWAIFSKDRQSVVVAFVDRAIEYKATPEPNELKLYDHPDWERLRQTGPTSLEAIDAGGEVVAEMSGFAFHERGFGTTHPTERSGYFLTSENGGGWFLEGPTLAVGLQTEAAGVFRTTLRTELDDVHKRLTQFPRWLLRAGLDDFATAAEAYAAHFVSHRTRGNQKQVMMAYKDMGLMRGFERSYEGAPDLHAEAFRIAQAEFSETPETLHDVGLHYARSLSARGDYEAAKNVLRELYSTLAAAQEAKSTILYRYHQAAGEAEFGLKNYAAAEKWFADCAAKMEAINAHGSQTQALLDELACHLAQGKAADAKATIDEAVASHEARKKANPKARYDTYDLSFACSAMQEWETALNYAPLSTRKSSVLYQEYARLVALLNRGDHDEAQKLANILAGRFDDTEAINIRRDIDSATVALMKATATMTPAATQEFQQVWSDQVENLRLRPLENYLFARNMVAAIAQLKQASGE